MLRKVMMLAVAGVLVAGAEGLFPVETSAGERGWDRQVRGHHEARHHDGHVTIITQPVQQVQIRPYYPQYTHHHFGAVYAPFEPVWVPADWHWTGDQWVWVEGYWR